MKVQSLGRLVEFTMTLHREPKSANFDPVVAKTWIMTPKLGQRTSSIVEVFTELVFAYFMKLSLPYWYFRLQLYNKLCFISYFYSLCNSVVRVVTVVTMVTLLGILKVPWETPEP